MKAAANGVLNLSILDGWWDEAYMPSVGWAIGRRETYEDRDYQDGIEADALYSILERDLIPMFYDRGRDGLPRPWIAQMKAAIGGLSYVYNTHRMIGEYAERLYMPAALQSQRLGQDDGAIARDLAGWKSRVRAEWPRVSISSAEPERLGEVTVGGQVSVRARVSLGSLAPGDLRVQLCIGRVDARGRFSDGEAIAMEPAGPADDGVQYYQATVTPEESGLHGYTLRVLPRHDELVTPFVPGLITWADTD
jgi:starch phosphorylase